MASLKDQAINIKEIIKNIKEVKNQIATVTFFFKYNIRHINDNLLYVKKLNSSKIRYR